MAASPVAATSASWLTGRSRSSRQYATTRSCRARQVDRTRSCAVSGSSSMCMLVMNIAHGGEGRSTEFVGQRLDQAGEGGHLERLVDIDDAAGGVSGGVD